MKLDLIILSRPISKKNHQQILINHKTGGRFISQSEAYKQYENTSVLQLKQQYKKQPIDVPVNVKVLCYMPTKGRCDLTNLLASVHDILVKAEVLKDDNFRIIVSVDGSRVLYDKENPRAEIFITDAVQEV